MSSLPLRGTPEGIDELDIIFTRMDAYDNVIYYLDPPCTFLVALPLGHFLVKLSYLSNLFTN